MKRVYICTPLQAIKFPLSKIHEILLANRDVFAFVPPVGQLQDRKTGALLDKQMIEICDEVWVFGPIGRDCAWEIGYAQGLGKPVIFYKDMTNRHIIEEDWMTILGNFTIRET